MTSTETSQKSNKDPSYTEEVKKQLLAEIAADNPKLKIRESRQAEWIRTQPNREIEISLPHDCHIDAKLKEDRAGKKRVEVGHNWVNSQLRGNGIGERLLLVLIATSIDLGAERIDSIVTNESSLKMRQKIFGDERMKFYKFDYHNFNEGRPGSELSITSDEAIAMLESFREQESDLDSRDRGIWVLTDLIGFNVEGWERPTAEVA